MRSIKTKKSRIFIDISLQIISILMALGVAGIVLFIYGFDPRAAFLTILMGAFGSSYGITATLLKMTPLLLTGLGIALTFKCGLTNLGAEGQLYMGALITGWLGLTLIDFSSLILLPLIIIMSFLVGALWAIIPGILKAKLDVNEIIVTFMMNFIAIYLTRYVVLGPLKNKLYPMEPQTDFIVPSAELPRISGTRIHLGVFIGIIFILVVYLIVQKTSLGFKIKAIGANLDAASYAGINVPITIIVSMAVSGGLAGLAGMGEVAGLHHRLMDGISPGYGYLAIAVALLGRNHPLGVLLSSFLFGVLLVGSDEMRRIMQVPTGIIYFIEGAVMLSILIAGIITQRRLRS
ncbi:MAG: ABC transporter permease [Candidatus Bathyarchaeia archaeon]